MKAVQLALALAIAAPFAAQAEGVIRDTTAPRLAAKTSYERKYGVAEQALQNCARFSGLAPKEHSLGNNTFEYVPHPAVKHAAEVDQPVRAPGRDPGQRLCEYVRQPQVTQWYKQNFKL